MASFFKLAKKAITPGKLGCIEDFYSKWEPTNQIDLKFRFLKAFIYNKNTDSFHWTYLHRKLQTRVFTNELVKDGCLRLIRAGIIPVRLFMSSSEWLYPYKIMGFYSQTSRLIKTGLISLEADESLEASIQLAQKLDPFLKRHKHNVKYVYTGNKSIHSWVFLDSLDWIPNPQSFVWTRREKAELLGRKSFFRWISGKTNLLLDKRTAIDPRRVVPYISSLNGMTGRIVKEIEDINVSASKLKEVLEQPSIYPI